MEPLYKSECTTMSMAESRHSAVTPAAGDCGGAGLSTDRLIIPDPLPPISFLPLSGGNYVCVAFNVQTTGFGSNVEIIQVAAIHQETIFNRYILPDEEIDDNASRVSNLTKKGDKLYDKGKPVETIGITQCLTEFCEFLSTFDKPLLLYGHNARVYYCHHLVDALSSCRLIDRFSTIVSGFSDTLKAIKRKQPGQEPNKVDDLVARFLCESYEARGILQNARAIQEIYNIVLSDKILLQYSFTVEDIRLRRSCIRRKETMTGMINEGIISKYMAQKIADTGLTHDHLVSCYNTGGKRGVRKLLTTEFCGKPRVTNKEDVLVKIVVFLKKNKRRMRRLKRKSSLPKIIRQ